MSIAFRLIALAAVAAVSLATSACATRQTTTDSQTAAGPTATRPGVSQPGQPGVYQPGVSQPGVSQPGASQPGAYQPGVAGRMMPGDPGSPQMSRPGASVTMTMPGGPTSLTDVFFDFDESNLSVEARRVLEQNAEYLRRNAQARVQIEGHADERGSTAYNLALGDRRATAAKRYLESLGVDASRVSTISFGEEKPFAMGQSEDAWAQNRRGHFVEVR